MKKIYLIIFLSSFFISCEKDKIYMDDTPSQKLISQFQKSHLQQLLPNGASIDWANEVSGYSLEFNAEITEIPVLLQSSISDLPESPKFYKLVAVHGKYEEVKQLFIAEFISFSQFEKASFFDLSNFSGTLKFFNSELKLHFNSLYFNGNKFTKYREDKKSNMKLKTLKEECFTLHTEYWTDYKDPYSGEILFSRLEYSTQQDYCTISDSGGTPDEEGNTNISGSSSTTVIERTEETLDENGLNEFVNIIIDPSINQYSCLAEVLNIILNSDSYLFEKTIALFMDNPKYNLTFTIGECSNTDLMCTDGRNVGKTGEIIIKIEDPTQNSIDLASQTFHEGIHAEIFRYVNEHHDGYVDPNDKPQLFDYYKHYKLHEPEPTEIDHIYMTQYYIDPIAKALRELDNNQYPLNFYKPFAWNGLRDYDPNNSLGKIDEDYLQYTDEVTANFNINCDE